jgi:hypothetical protein
MQVHSFSWVHSIEFSLITMAIPEVHATLPADKIASIMADLDDVQKQLDFLIGLTPDERREIPKMGIKQHDFVTHSLDMAADHPELMPGCLNVGQARQDIALYEALNPILQSINQLRKLVQDTQIVVGSEAYAAARLAYSSAKATSKGQGMDDTLQGLSRHFHKTRRNGSKQATNQEG